MSTADLQLFAVIGIYGLVIGSFLNVCIYRIPRESFMGSLRSRCPNCDTPIPWFHNIPVVSYLILLGKARCCDVRISFQYPLVEVLTAAGFILGYLHFPFFIGDWHSWDIHPESLVRYGHFVVFYSLMVVCTFVDAEHQIIPDVISLPMVALSPAVAGIHPDLTLQSSLLGVVLGGGLLYGVAWLYWIVRKEYGLGMGDVKLLAGIGGWLGYQVVIPTIFLASVLGSVVGISFILLRRDLSLKSAIPFGPFIALAAVIYFLYGSDLMIWVYGL